MQADTRLWWTSDRSRLVEDGNDEAAFLAYRQGEEVAAIHEGLLGTPEPEQEKQAKAPANKSRARGQDKSGD